MIIRSVLTDAINFLKPIVGDSAEVDATILLLNVLDVNRTGLVEMFDQQMTVKQEQLFQGMLNQRAKHQPVSQIISRRAFWNLEFIVTPDVLDPRADTETLIERALQHENVKTILDLGVGSGCILLTLLHEMKTAQGIGVDISADAILVAKRNADQTGLADRANFFISDWFEKVEGKFDLIVSNPPYISEEEMKTLSPEVINWEPKIALTPGGDGLSVYRKIAKEAKAFLQPGGRLLVEFGWQQSESVHRILADEGWKEISIHNDLDGNTRVIEACL